MKELDILQAEIILGLGLQTDLAKVILPVILANLRLLDQKQQDYGSINLTKFGTFGVAVRMNDKLERIINLIRTPPTSGGPRNEPLDDSFLDLANYALIAYVMHRDLWPKRSQP